MILTTQSCKEELGQLHDKCTALINLAKEEERDLTDDEQKTFDEHQARSLQIRKTDLPRAEWLEAEEERLSTSTPKAGLQIAAGPQPSGLGFGRPLIDLPKAALYWQNRLKAFTGDGGLEDACRASHFYAATLWGSRKSRTWCEQHDIEIYAAMSEDSLEKGAALVPLEIERRLTDLAEEYGTARAKCENVPMGSDVKIWPRVTGGLTVYFPGEAGSITASDMAFDNIRLVVRKAATLTKVSSELDEDSMIPLADLITRKIALAFATKEDQILFLGDATSTYAHISGLITECAAATATVVTAATANTAFSTLDLADFESMIGKLPEYPGIQPEWYISKPGWAASMMRLQDAAGGNTVVELEGRRRFVFLGYPVNLVQCMNTTLTAQTSTSGLCYFGDLAMAAAFGNRRGMTVATSQDVYFANDQIGIRGTERFDINVHSVGDTSSAGAMIMLSTPSS